MSVQNAEINKATVKTDAIGVAARLRNISPNQRCGRPLSETEIELGLPRKVRQQIRSHWCRGCGTYMTNPDGLCAKCRQPLVEEYKAKLNSPAEIGLSASLIAEGYSQHFNAIDAEVAREHPCKLCGHVCYYLGFKKGASYKAISRCTGCGNEYEF